MEDVAAQEGRTVLFVSHNMAAIQTLCRRVLWLDGGTIARNGESAAVIEAYGKDLQRGNGGSCSTILKGLDGDFEIEGIVTKDESGNPTSVFPYGTSFTVEIRFFARRPIPRPYFWVGIRGQGGNLFAANMLLDGVRPDVLEGRGHIRCTFNKLPLLPSQSYSVVLGGRREDGISLLFKSTEVTYFLVTGSAKDIGLKGELADSLVGDSGPVFVPYAWEFTDGEWIPVHSI
jgi:lipopolysaccharide transport system ATP-binding protein